MKKKHAQQLGKLGGLVKSETKAKAAQENGKKGGRPKKTIPNWMDCNCLCHGDWGELDHSSIGKTCPHIEMTLLSGAPRRHGRITNLPYVGMTF